MNSKIVSFKTHCAVCNKEITKKNKQDGFYFCDDCFKLDDIEKVMKTLQVYITNKDIGHWSELVKDSKYGTLTDEEFKALDKILEEFFGYRFE